MTAVLDVPAREGRPPPRRDVRSTRALVAVLAAASLVLLALSMLRALPGTVSFAPVAPAFGGSAPVVTLPKYGPEGTYVVGYEHGEDVVMTLSVKNTGLLPVTVTSASFDAGVAPLLEIREVSGLPLGIGAGETRRFEVTGVLGNCRFFHEREVQYYRAVDLGFSVLGQDGTRTVELDRQLMVHSPMIVGCPDRLLNRQGNDRSDLTDAA
jgi:hypothetical protein